MYIYIERERDLYLSLPLSLYVYIYILYVYIYIVCLDGGDGRPAEDQVITCKRRIHMMIHSINYNNVLV